MFGQPDGASYGVQEPSQQNRGGRPRCIPFVNFLLRDGLFAWRRPVPIGSVVRAKYAIERVEHSSASGSGHMLRLGESQAIIDVQVGATHRFPGDMKGWHNRSEAAMERCNIQASGGRFLVMLPQTTQVRQAQQGIGVIDCRFGGSAKIWRRLNPTHSEGEGHGDQWVCS